jgi:hypothetical protein
MNMKEFNLEKALAGEPVVTNDGKPVTQLTYFDTKDINCLVGDVDGTLRKFTIDGVSFADDTKSLCMSTKKMCCWVNVYQNGYHKNLFVGDSYGSKQTALENKNNIYDIEKHQYIKTIRITNDL